MDRRRFVAAGAALAAMAAKAAGAQHLERYEVPSTAVIRGENIWLRAEPAAETEIVTYLQRGDEVTLTDATVRADGADFVPVETANGESGWVRDLFVNPRSIAPASEPERRNERAAAEEALPADEAGAAEDRQNRRQRRQNRDAAAGTDAAEEPPAAPAPGPVETPEPAASPSSPEPEAADPSAVGASPENPAPKRTLLRGDGVAVVLGGGRFVDAVGSVTPQDGNAFLEFTVRIGNIDAADKSVGPENFRVQDTATGTSYESALLSVDGELPATTLPPRENITGTVYFEVEAATRQVIVKFDADPSTPESLNWSVP